MLIVKTLIFAPKYYHRMCREKEIKNQLNDSCFIHGLDHATKSLKKKQRIWKWRQKLLPHNSYPKNSH